MVESISFKELSSLIISQVASLAKKMGQKGLQMGKSILKKVQLEFEFWREFEYSRKNIRLHLEEKSERFFGMTAEGKVIHQEKRLKKGYDKLKRAIHSKNKKTYKNTWHPS